MDEDAVSEAEELAPTDVDQRSPNRGDAADLTDLRLGKHQGSLTLASMVM